MHLQNNELTRKHCHSKIGVRFKSIISHISRGRAKFSVRLNNFIDSVQEVLLGRDFPSGADGVHSGFRADAADLSSGAVRTETSQQLVANVTFDAHRTSVNLEDFASSFQVWKAKLHFSVHSAGPHQGRVEGVGAVRCHENLVDKFERRH